MVRLTAKMKQGLAELELAAESLDFLVQWQISDADELARLEAYAATATPGELDGMAFRNGFRTWSQLLNYCRDRQRVTHHFAHDATFQLVWKRLRKVDQKHGFVDLFGPHNGGVPAKLLRSVEEWHRQPKFTVSERRQQWKKIAKASSQLVALLSQVTPASVFDDFDELAIDGAMADKIFSVFGTPQKRIHPEGRSAYSESARAKGQRAAFYLRHAGLSPLVVVESIRSIAESAPRRALERTLPRKVRAATAYRTFMILEVAQSMSLWTRRNALPIGDQLIADAVSLIVNMDCSIDDVRKALADWRSEDSD